MGRLQYRRIRFGLPENKEIEEAYLKKLRESGGFDLRGVVIPKGAPVAPCPMVGPCLLEHLYARLGLHRYNMLEGGNWKPLCIINLNMARCHLSVLYITLAAVDAATGTEKVFQVKVSQSARCYLNCTCTVARPHPDDETHPPIRPTPTPFVGILGDHFRKDSLPDWPQSEDEFYAVEESELEEKYSWVRLYLELVVTAGVAVLPDRVSHLKIVKAFIDSEPENLNATVYIAYKDTDPYKHGKGVNRIAIVRRSYDETTQQFVLLGKYECLPVKKRKRSETVNENETRVSPRTRKPKPETVNETRVSPRTRKPETVNERRVSPRTRKPIQRFGNTEAI